MINPGQIKAARAMLNLSQKQLAKKAGISVSTLNNIERGAQIDPKISTMRAIRQALEAKGIEFTNEYAGIGIVLRSMMSPELDAKILIVDDSIEDRTLYKHWLDNRQGHRKYHVIEAENAKTGYGAFIEHKPDCIILDFKMYGIDGFQLLAEMKKDHSRLPPIVFVSGLHNDVMKESAKRQGVAAYLNKKNLTKEGFHEAIERALA